MELCSKAAAQVKASTAFCFARNTPLKLPSAVRGTKDLWRAVMTTQYGDYDRDRRCWRTKYELEGDVACMRPLRLDARAIQDEWRFYLVAGSRDLDIAGHVSPGLIGLFIVSQRKDRYELIAALPFEEIGSWGRAPEPEAFRLVKFGDPSNWGWAIKTGYGNQGYWDETFSLYGGIPPVIGSLGWLPASHSDSGNCDGGKNMTTGQPCYSYEFRLSVDSSKTSPFNPIILQGSGTKDGRPYSRRFWLPFDRTKQEYFKVSEDATEPRDPIGPPPLPECFGWGKYRC
jgi:hypothetical protein